MWIVECHG